MLKITDAARDKIKEALEKYPGKALRIFFDGFG
jgi:Fe-S cluster assembly iron-binding protein IscA